MGRADHHRARCAAARCNTYFEAVREEFEGAVNEQVRRRSARSMLLTVLGEYVLPGDDGVWQETLIGALGTLGYKPQAARQALARSVTGGWLRTERHGRRARVHLTGEAREMLATGAERIYSFGEPWEWDGRWLLVVVRVPEERRDVRHLMRSRLAWAGFGSLGNGLWITPHVEREAELRRRGEPAAELLSFRAEFGEHRRAGQGRRRRLGPRRRRRPLPRVHRPLRAPAPAHARRTRSARRPSSCTPGASSRSSIPTCRRRRSRPAGRARARSGSSPSATRSGRRPPRSGSSRWSTRSRRAPPDVRGRELLSAADLAVLGRDLWRARRGRDGRDGGQARGALHRAPAQARVTTLRGRLAKEASTAGRPADWAELIGALEAARAGVATWTPQECDGATLRAGAVRAYSRGRDALAAAESDPSAENLHEWRKRVKDLWYHQRLLRNAWKEPLKAMAAESHELADLLGDEHDLAVLAERLTRSADLTGGALLDAETMQALIAERRAELQAAALDVGRRVYAEKPKAYGRRLARYLEAARAEWPDVAPVAL